MLHSIEYIGLLVHQWSCPLFVVKPAANEALSEWHGFSYP